MEYEVKKIMDAWETRCEYDQTPYTLCEYLEQIRQKQSECLQILEEDGNTLYDEVSKERLDTLMQQWNDVFSYATMLRRRMSELLDEPFKRDLGMGAVEYLSHINLSDYRTENTVGLTSEITYQDQRGGSTSVTYRRPYDSLTFSHFLGSWAADELAKADGGGAGDVGVVTAGSTMLDNPSGDTPAGAVLLAGGVVDPNMAMFANIFAGQYAAMEESGAFEESEIEDLQGYLDMLEVQGEYEYEYDSASTCVKIANRILDLFVIPNLIEAALGQELLTGRELDNGERAMKVVVGVLNAVGMRQALSANGIVNVTSVEALSVIGKVAIVNGAADLTAYGVSWIGEELGLPMPVTVLLSLVLGITVDYEMGCYIFRNGDGSILRRIKAKGAEEVLENGPYTSFADLMSPEDAERYLKFLETGSTAGLTEAEIAAIRRVDELLALERITYQDILDMRNANNVIEGSRYSKYIEQLDGFSENRINHIINGSRGSNHGWENLVPDKNWNDIKNIIAEVMETGVEGSYKTVYSKKVIINGFEVEVTYTKLSDGTIKISDAWINQ